jgi:hypothetical protein
VSCDFQHLSTNYREQYINVQITYCVIIERISSSQKYWVTLIPLTWCNVIMPKCAIMDHLRWPYLALCHIPIFVQKYWCLFWLWSVYWFAIINRFTHLHVRSISPRGEVWVHKISLTPPLCISAKWVPTLSLFLRFFDRILEMFPQCGTFRFSVYL